ncbi:MAG: hypothetical protein ACJ8LM_08915 [Candidatus Udaeobacter sp.]
MDKTLKDAVVDRQVQQAHYEQQRRDQNIREKKSHSPDLIQHNCCNAVALIEEIMPNGTRMFGIPIGETIKEIPSRYNLNSSYVVEIVNIGRGLAKSVKATWIPRNATKLDGTVIPAPAGMSFPGQTSPYYIQAGQSAFIRHLPKFYWFDGDTRLATVDGILELSCLDIEDDGHGFRYRFSMQTKRDIYHFSDQYSLDSVQIYIDDRKLNDHESVEPTLAPTPADGRIDDQVKPAF